MEFKRGLYCVCVKCSCIITMMRYVYVSEYLYHWFWLCFFVVEVEALGVSICVLGGDIDRAISVEFSATNCSMHVGNGTRWR